jgi:hypothetical protein
MTLLVVRATKENELKRIWEEAVAAYLKVLTWCLASETKENRKKKPHSG